MAIVTGEVIPDPAGSRHFRVVIKHDGDEIGSWDVSTKAQGEHELLDALREIISRKEEEGR